MSPTPTTTTSTGPIASAVIPQQRGAGERRPVRRRFAVAGLLVCAVSVLLLGYLRMARTNGTNADGSANVLQARDLLHGNLGLAGWTLSDVSFYPTELVQYTLIELFTGMRSDVVHVAAAITYVLLMAFAARVAREGATGRAAWARVAVVVAVLLVPSPGSGFATVLNVPDHTGTAVPLLVAALLFGHRDRLGRYWPVAVAAVLTLAQVGDPLAMYIGALPLATVSAGRLLRAIWTRGDRTVDTWLLICAAASVALSRTAVALIGAAGGYRVHAPIAAFTSLDAIPGHLMLLGRTTALDYGVYWPHLIGHHPALTLLYQTAGVIKLLLMAAALVGTVVTIGRLVRGRDDDRVAQWLAVAIAVNLAAYVASTQAGDMASARQVVAVLPFGAVLAARLLGDRLTRLRLRTRVAAGVLAAVLVAAFTAEAAVARPTPPEASAAAAWLEAHDLHYGLGAYWASNSVTVATRGRVQVAPVTEPVPRAFHWESRADWFDATRHDARFVIIDNSLEQYGTVSGAAARFGPPTQRVDLGRWTILVYDHNLLPQLPLKPDPRPRPKS